MTDVGIDLTDRLAVVVPSMGRPDAIDDVIQAWRETDADQGGQAVLVVAQHQHETDAGGAYALPPGEDDWLIHYVSDTRGMVASLNAAALWAFEHGASYIGFAGDDHLPRSQRWDVDLIAALDDLVARRGVGAVYGDDLLMGQREATAFAVSRSWVATLGRLVPAIVGHLYSDTSVRELAAEVDALRYLPRVVIEHMHPLAGKRPWDAQTRAVNSRAQSAADRAVWRRWHQRPAATDKATGLRKQAAMLRTLRPVDAS